MRQFTPRELLSAGTRLRVIPESGRVEDHQARQYKYSLLSLLELTHGLSGRHDLYAITDMAIASLIGHVGTTRAALWILPEENQDDLILLRAQGISKRVAGALGRFAAAHLLARFAIEPYPETTEDLEEHLAAGEAVLIRDAGIALFAPLIARGRLMGLLALGRSGRPDTYTSDLIEILRAQIGIAATALDNAWQHGRLLEINRNLRSANEELESLDRLKTDFIRTLDDELRTPLTVLVNYIEMYREHCHPTGREAEWLDIVADQATKLRDRILTLLDWKTLTDGKAAIDPNAGSAVEFLEDYYAERQPGVTSKLRKFLLQIEDDVDGVLFDEERLTQILDVLLDNAQKFTPQGTVIRLRASRVFDGDLQWLLLDLSDDGPGIPEDRLPSIFDSFRQIESTLTRTRGGMGMGLTLAKRLTELMGGHLDVQSKLGVGSTFTVRLHAVETTEMPKAA